MTKRKRSANHKLQQITVTVPYPICNTLFILGSRIKRRLPSFWNKNTNGGKPHRKYPVRFSIVSSTKEAENLLLTNPPPLDFFIFVLSVTDKRKQRNMTRSFNGLRQFSLMFRTCACNSAGQNFRTLRRELSQSCDIFIINFFNLFLAEHANLFPSAVSALASRFLLSIHCDETSYFCIL